MPTYKTADLCDERTVAVADPIFRDLGGLRMFAGPVATVQVAEDNGLVKATLSQPGQGRVLVVDGGGSMRCALVGDVLAGIGLANGWTGVVVFGCVRDTAQLSQLAFGVRALGTCPRRGAATGAGSSDVAVTFAGITFRRGDHLYADHDGIVVSRGP